MNFLRKMLARGRIRRARRALAESPDPRTYANLAQEYARVGDTDEVVRVCEEGLAVHAGNAQLARFLERARRLHREERVAELKAELEESPRPAVWQELCEILLEGGDLARAEETALSWQRQDDDPEARFLLARVRLERFYADRGRDQGRAALQGLDETLAALPNDTRALRAKMDFLVRIGAWRDARQCAGRLLQLEPGSPALEGRYRTLDSLADDSPSVERALIEVERTGRLADEKDAREERTGSTDARRSVQPVLRELAADPDVNAAIYVRGSTVLVQGPKGATAERTARAVHSILTSSRSAGRRLGLGTVFQVTLEGSFGALTIAPGEQDAGAVWSEGPLGRIREDALYGLAGSNADAREVNP